VKDIKDFEGDRQNGIVNIYTILGKQKGKVVTTFLIFLTFNIPAVIFMKGIFLLVSSTASFVYYKFENIQAVYICGITAAYLSLVAVIP